MCVVPLVLALPLAYALWRKGDIALGNIAGMGIIFVVAVWLIVLEYSEIGRWSQACLDAGHICEPTPSSFIRYAIYAAIGVIDVSLVFFLSLKFEERDRNSTYSPEWRR